MTARFITGSKQEIARKVAGLEGDVREAIVFIEESANASITTTQGVPDSVEEMFKEMEPYMAHSGGNVDYSRQAVYTRKQGE